MVLRLEIQSTSFWGYRRWGYRGYERGDTGDTAGNTCYRVHGVMDVVIQGDTSGDTSDKLQGLFAR